MKKEVFSFFSSLRQIYGVCPCCGDFFRLSDCKLYQKARPGKDWMERLDDEIEKLEKRAERIQAKIEETREKALEAGRKEADKLVKKIDPIFRPLNLNPNDGKVIFHPVDFIVFKGMNTKALSNCIDKVILLDHNNKKGEQLKIQKSIEKAILKKSYEWITLRVKENGQIIEE